MKLRLILIGTFVGLGSLTLLGQNRPNPPSSTHVGRYVSIVSNDTIDKVLDTETGRIFVWLPLNPTNEVWIKDPINAISIIRPVQMNDQK